MRVRKREEEGMWREKGERMGKARAREAKPVQLLGLVMVTCITIIAQMWYGRREHTFDCYCTDWQYYCTVIVYAVDTRVDSAHLMGLWAAVWPGRDVWAEEGWGHGGRQ